MLHRFSSIYITCRDSIGPVGSLVSTFLLSPSNQPFSPPSITSCQLLTHTGPSIELIEKKLSFSRVLSLLQGFGNIIMRVLGKPEDSSPSPFPMRWFGRNSTRFSTDPKTGDWSFRHTCARSPPLSLCWTLLLWSWATCAYIVGALDETGKKGRIALVVDTFHSLLLLFLFSQRLYHQKCPVSRVKEKHSASFPCMYVSPPQHPPPPPHPQSKRNRLKKQTACYVTNITASTHSPRSCPLSTFQFSTKRNPRHAYEKGATPPRNG